MSWFCYVFVLLLLLIEIIATIFGHICTDSYRARKKMKTNNLRYVIN
jgi:hypothetical protein